MISILTLTYKRKEQLEEAIHSYLIQPNTLKVNTEMVIINDDPNTTYHYNHPNIKIYNLKERFSSIGKKMEWGFKQCKYNWIYRLDDDDLLSPYALNLLNQRIKENPNKDIIRDRKHYAFIHNTYEEMKGSLNCGNCYNKNYINRIGEFIDKSFGEDDWLNNKNNADIQTYNETVCTMIFRWGMNIYHVQGMGDITNEEINNTVDKLSNSPSGNITLQPQFKNKYWEQLL
jgi:hypothetical protein